MSVELIPGGERRRQWTVGQKQMIIAEGLALGASPTVVVRHYGIGTGQKYNWQRALMAARPAIGRFAWVDITPPLTTTFDGGTAIAGPASAVAATSRTPELIEIVLPDSTAIRVDTQIYPRASRRVLAVQNINAVSGHSHRLFASANHHHGSQLSVVAYPRFGRAIR